MRFLLSHKLPYFSGHAGATRTVRSIMRLLAARGHEAVVVCRESFAGKGSPPGRSRPDLSSALTVDHGVKVYALPNEINFEKSLDHVVGLWQPDCVLIGEDPTYLSVAVALDRSVERIVLLAQSQATLPFGPEAFYPDTMRTALLRAPTEIVVFSHYVRKYVQQWAQLEAVQLPPALHEQLKAPKLGRYENSYVMLINASGLKGLPVFVQLAQHFPSTRFAAVCGWATTSNDIRELNQYPNVTVLRPNENVDEIFSQARVLLVPSLWGEAFGFVVVEAMARGIPVFSSDVGGLPEAKLGVDYVLPVNPIRSYGKTLDERLLPKAVVPEQDPQPWCDALQLLLNDPERYDRLSAASRSAAMQFLENLDQTRWLDYFEGK